MGGLWLHYGQARGRTGPPAPMFLGVLVLCSLNLHFYPPYLTGKNTGNSTRGAGNARSHAPPSASTL